MNSLHNKKKNKRGRGNGRQTGEFGGSKTETEMSFKCLGHPTSQTEQFFFYGRVVRVARKESICHPINSFKGAKCPEILQIVFWTCCLGHTK